MIMNKNLEIKLSTTQNQIEFLENVLDKYKTQEKDFLNLLDNMDTDENFCDKFQKQLKDFLSDHLFDSDEYKILDKILIKRGEKNNYAVFIPFPPEITPQTVVNSSIDNALNLLVKYLVSPDIISKEFNLTRRETSNFLDFYKDVVSHTLKYFQPLLIEKRDKGDYMEFNNLCENFFHYLRWKATFVLTEKKIIRSLIESKTIDENFDWLSL